MSLPTEPGNNSKNSVFVGPYQKVIGSIPILPIRDSVKGGAEPAFDIVDEVIYHYRTNIWMRNFKIATEADRLLIYLTFYAQKCVKMFAQQKDKTKAKTQLESWNLNPFPLPGDSSFILSSLVTEPDKADVPALRAFLKQCRVEVGYRLLNKVFQDNTPDKWWSCFGSRKFMDKDMQN